MKTQSSLGLAARQLMWLLFAFVSCLPVMAQEGRAFPLGPIGGYYSVAGGTSLALVRSVDAGGAGATAGLQAGDFIYGAFGQTFTPTGGDHYGVTQELGFAVDRAEGGDGTLPLLVMRPGTGGITINVALSAAGAFGTAYPRNSSKYAGMYETAVADLHARAMNSNGSMGYLTGFTGLCLLGHPNWNDTTGTKPYRLSINKIRDYVVSQITNGGYAPTETQLIDGSAIPNPSGGLSNWELGQLEMFLSEYYVKTSDSSVVASLQRGAEMCSNSVQWWKQPSETGVGGFSPEYGRVAGMSSHGGVSGDYMHQWYCGINAAGVHNLNGLAFARSAGVNMNVRPKDGHYFGFNVNPGDPIPAGIANALPSSITLPQYADDPDRGSVIQNTSSPLDRSDASDPFFYNPSLAQKFLMQMNFICRYSMANGSVRYAPEVGDDPDSVRTAGALLGMALYQKDVGGLDSADLDRLESMKRRTSATYMAQQNSHAYCFMAGQTFQAFCMPFLSDRQQRFSLDNWRFYYALSRTANNGYRYFQGRFAEDAGEYLDNNHCASINIALPYGIANGGYSLIPAYNTNRTLANFKSPFLMWPSIAARTATVYSSSQAFQVDVCDGNGNLLDPANYTATWSHVSGPGTATFSSGNTANTTVTLPSVSTTPYRIRLTVTRTGVPDLVEDIDVTRSNTPTSVANAITSQPANQTTVPGGSASFTVGVTGTGPFIYQWRLNGVAYWGGSLSPVFNLGNIGSGAIGSYDCVVSTPTGVLISNPATLSFNATLVRTQGGLKREIWMPAYGPAVGNLTNYSSFPLFPNITTSVTATEAPLFYGDNYGQKLSGWIKPPVSGSYKFFMSSDDSAELWLSTDANAANKVKIISSPYTQFRSYATASPGISLIAGQKYYIEILHKEAGDGDHVSVAWQIPGEPAPVSGSEPIPGAYLEYDQYLPLLTNHFKLDEASGATCADSVGTATATLYNSPTRVAGILGNAVSFNGVDQYAQATLDVSETTSAVSLWFRTTQQSGGLYSVVESGGGYDRGIFLNGGNISSYIYSGETIASTGRNYADGQWHHVIHTFGGAIGGQKLYVDGVQVAAGGKSQSDFGWQTAIRIGYTPNTPYFNGQIDDVRIYTAGLSLQDVVAIYNYGINAAPVVSPGNFTLTENSPVGTTVGTITATDPNAGQTITYSITGGNTAGRFALNPSTGAITLAVSPDFEFSGAYVLTITATDNGTPVQSATTTATITITNINEAPVFANNPIIGQPAAPGIAYNGTLTAFDPEAAGAVTYAKISGPSWLSLASNGVLTGTPATGNVGTNNFTVRATDSTSQSIDVTLRIEVVDVAVNPVWTNAAGGSWPVAGNWLSNGVANGQSMVADFSTLNLTADSTVTLDGARTIGGLKFGETTPSHNWWLNTGSAGQLTLSVASGSPVISVVNQAATISAVVAGTQGFVKSGSGTLALSAANTYSGTTTLSAGLLMFYTNNLVSTSGYTINDANTGSANSTLQFCGDFSNNRNGLSGIGLRDFSPITITGNGTGTSTLNFNSNTYIWLNGTIAISKPVVLKSTGAGIRAGFVTISGNGAGVGNDSVIYDATGSGNNSNWNTYENPGTYAPQPNTYLGNVRFTGGFSSIQNKTYANAAFANLMIPDTASVKVDLNSTFNFGWGGESIDALNDGVGGGGTVTSASDTLTVGVSNGSGAFSGVISSGMALVKSGTGTQLLGGANSYTGPTTITGGSLIVTGSLGNTPTTINAAGKLGGTGTIGGTVTNNGFLAPGNNAIGNLTINNTLTLATSSSIAWEVADWNGAAGTGYDKLTATSLNLTATTGSPVTIRLSNANLVNFLENPRTFTLLQTTSGITGFDPAKFVIDTSALSGMQGVWSIQQSGNNLNLVYISPNSPPAFTSDPLLASAVVNYAISGQLDASDPDFDEALTFTKISGPAWLTVAANGALSGTPGSGTVGANNFTVRVTDSHGAFDTAALNVNVIDYSNTTLWTNSVGGSWPVAGNWFGNTVADGNTKVADFSTLNLTADATINLDGTRTIGGLKFGDTTPSHNWTLNVGGGTPGPLTLQVVAGVPAVTVTNQTATVNTVLAGNQGLIKSGAGTLALGAANTYSGTTVISQGRLQFNVGNALPSTANIVIGDANSGSTAPNLNFGSQLAPTFATLTVGTGVANASVHTSGWAPTIIGLTTLNSPLTIQQYNAGYIHTGIQTIGKITGPGAGAGNDTLIFRYGGGQNFYWQAGNTVPNDFIGNIRITGAPGGLNLQGGANGANNVVFPDAALVTMDAGCNLVWNNFGNSAVVETFDGLAGAGSIFRNTGGGMISSLNLTINANNSANEGRRVFTGGLASLDSFTFGGTGTQVFGGASSYTGPTTINGGTLIITGSLANTPTTINAAGKLGGTGTLAGTVTNNGTIAPGNNAIGNLTVNNTLTLAASSGIAWQVADWAGTAGTGYDKLTSTSLNLTATTANPITIRLSESALTNFTEASKTFTLVQTTSGITGFSAGKFVIDASALTTPQGTWVIQQSGNNLLLAYTRSNTAPVFAVNPMQMNGTQGSAISSSISATDPDLNETLTYAKISGPAWLSISTSGALSGTPGNSNVGLNSFSVQVTDSFNASAPATLQITVANINDAPVFTTDPINLGATEDSAFTGQLAATDVDAVENLTYTKRSGPAWLTVSSSGALGGTPANGDVGPNGFTVRVTDSAGAFDEATLNITVANVNDAPTWVSATITKPNATEGVAYTGSLAGDASDVDALDPLTFSKVGGPAWLSVAANGALSGTPASADAGLNAITVRVTDAAGAFANATLNITVPSANGIWTNAAGGGWSSGANWSGGAIAYGAGKTADFSTLNLTANAAVSIDGSRLIGNLLFGDTTPSHNWTLNSGGPITLDVATGTPAITVNNQTATIDAIIAGTKGLNKAGAGTLVLSGANTYTGGMTLSGGLLYLGGVSGTAMGGDLTITSGANGYTQGVYLLTDQTSGVLHFNSIGWNYVRTNGHNWTVAGLDNLTGTTNNGVIENGGINTNMSTSGTMTINVANGNARTYSGTMRNADSGGGTGLLSIIKTGAGTQTLKGSSIVHTGNTTVNAGTLILSQADSNWTLPSGTKTIASGATLKVDFSPQTTQYRQTNLGSTVINTGGVLDLYSTMDNVNSYYLINAWTASGAGTIRVTGGGSIANWIAGNAFSDFTGLLDIQNGRFAVNINSAGTLGGTLDVNVASTGKLDLRSGHFTIDALDGVAGSSVHKSYTGDTINFTIGNGNGSGAFAGAMSGTNYNVIKAGTGTQIFSGANTYTGTTTVTGGALLINGSLATTATTVAVGGKLGGTGTIAGTVTNNGTLAPGNNAVGNLTVNNAVTAAPGSSIDWQISNWTGAAGTGWDKLTATSLNLTATSVNPVVLRLSQSALANFTESSQSFTLIQTSGGITGFATNKFVIDTTALTTPQGAWAVQQSGNNLELVYTRYNVAPVFANDPILAADGTIGSAYTGTLAGQASDANPGDTITYSKISGPAWLSVATNGALSGTPPSGSGGLNSFVVRVTDGAAATDDAALRINVLSVPLPWTNGDIGSGMLAGSVSESGGTYTQAGSGTLGGISDKLQYAYQTLSGDGEIIARVSSLQNTGSEARIGVMIRESLAANSRQAFMGMSGSGTFCAVNRTTTGGTNTTTSGSTGTAPNTWVRLVRSGDTLTAYESTNGTSWTSVGSATVTMATNCYIGLAVSSGSDTTLNTSQFSNVSVTP